MSLKQNHFRTASKLHDFEQAAAHVREARHYHAAFDRLVEANFKLPTEFADKLHEMSLTPNHISVLIGLLSQEGLSFGSGSTPFFSGNGGASSSSGMTSML